MNIVILGLTITSSWGNGHATTYRSLVRGLAAAGHSVTFFERDAPWYEGNRDEPNPEGARTVIYRSVEELIQIAEQSVTKADLVIVGSFVPDGITIGCWVTSISRRLTAFYDIDTPITLSSLEDRSCCYLTPELIPRYSMYLSFTGGPALEILEGTYRSRMARALYCSVDTSQYIPLELDFRWDLGYLGTWSEDRQPSLDDLLLKPAREWSEGRFAVVGPQYPDNTEWPDNVHRDIHLSPRQHPEFYGAQRFTLNITRSAMKQAGFSPSVRLFEASACAAPIISDWWNGLDMIFEPNRDIFLSFSAEDTLRLLRDTPDTDRRQVGHRARQRVLREHSPKRRARQLEEYCEAASLL